MSKIVANYDTPEGEGFSISDGFSRGGLDEAQPAAVDMDVPFPDPELFVDLARGLLPESSRMVDLNAVERLVRPCQETDPDAGAVFPLGDDEGRLRQRRAAPGGHPHGIQDLAQFVEEKDPDRRLVG